MKIKAIDGLPVEDAKRPITLHVTKGDCAEGNIKEPASCAAAKALRREFHAKEVRVHLSRVYVKTSPDKWVRYAVSPALRTEIIAFDRGGTFSPGEYYLKAVKPSIRLGSKRKQYKRTGTHAQRGTRAKQHVLVDVRGGPA